MKRKISKKSPVDKLPPLKENETLTGYELECLNCHYQWRTRLARISAICPSCGKKIHGTSKYRIVDRLVDNNTIGCGGCCGVGLLPTTLLFLLFITIIPSKKALFKIINFHQSYTSRFLSKLNIKCQYHTTCSRYGREAIEKYGARKGGWKAIGRLIRCNPLFTKNYYDAP